MLLFQGQIWGSSLLDISNRSLIRCAICSIEAMVIVEEQCSLIVDKLAHTDTSRVYNEVWDAISFILYAKQLILQLSRFNRATVYVHILKLELFSLLYEGLDKGALVIIGLPL